jgi:hypothetical protein
VYPLGETHTLRQTLFERTTREEDHGRDNSKHGDVRNAYQRLFRECYFEKWELRGYVIFKWLQDVDQWKEFQNMKMASRVMERWEVA